MRITCPQCHARCRLKDETIINDASQGKCPECGHVFPIPPGVIRKEPATSDHFDKSKKAGFGPGFKIHEIGSFLKRNRPFGKPSRFWLLTGLSLTALLAVLFFGPGKTSPPGSLRDIATKPSPTTTKQPAKFILNPQAQSKAITQIKHHALVGDANISITNNQIQLALLVTGNTPVTYAERLGRQFAHYLKEQLTVVAHQQEREPIIKVSVYYPGGTRIEVATNDQSGEEEVLPQSHYQR